MLPNLLIGLVLFLYIPRNCAILVAPKVPDLYVQVSQDLPVLNGQELEEIKESVFKIPEINSTLEDLDSNIEDISDFAASSNDIDDDWKSLGSSKFRRGEDEELAKIHQPTVTSATNLPPFAFSEDHQEGVEHVDSDVSVALGQPAYIQQSWKLHTTRSTTEVAPITTVSTTMSTTMASTTAFTTRVAPTTNGTPTYNAKVIHAAWVRHLAKENMVPAFKSTTSPTTIGTTEAFNSKLDLRRPPRVTIFGAPMKGESKKRTFSTTVKTNGSSLHDQIRATSQILNLLGDKIETIDQAHFSQPRVAVLSNIYNRGVRRLKQKQWGSSLRGRLGRHRQIMEGRGKYVTKAILEAPESKKRREHGQSVGVRRRKEKNFAEALLESEEESFKQLKSTLRQIRDVVKLKSIATSTNTNLSQSTDDSSSFGGSFDFVRKLLK